MNPKLVVRDCSNPQLGKGVFTTERIPKGEVICIADGMVVPFERYVELPEHYPGYCCDISDTEMFCPRDFERPNIDWFINHSCEPNIGSAGDIYTLVAMRGIERGEEVLLDYAMVDGDPDPRWDWECYGDAKNCRNVITGGDWMRPELQERYRGYFQKNVQEKIDALRGERGRAVAGGLLSKSYDRYEMRAHAPWEPLLPGRPCARMTAACC